MRESRRKRLQQRLEQFEHRTARTLINAAARVPAWLGARFSREIDGARLHPELQFLLAMLELRGQTGISAATPALARARMRREARVHAGPTIPVGAVRDLTFDGPGGPLRARLYTPPGASSRERPPLLVFYHGGGFVSGDLDTHDQPCRTLCRELNVFVLSIEYRLAPEHPFPAAVEDACAALRFAHESAESFGADPGRIGVAGDSAGGNLATVACQLAAQAGDPLPVMQLLLYPTVDSTVDRPSVGLFGKGFFLTHRDILWFREHYVGTRHDLADPRISPLLAPSLGGLPPALIVTAAFDPLRDEGEAYAEALQAAGTHVELYRVPDLVHGFINLGALSRASYRALLAVSARAHDLLWSPRGVGSPAEAELRASS